MGRKVEVWKVKGERGRKGVNVIWAGELERRPFSEEAARYNRSRSGFLLIINFHPTDFASFPRSRIYNV